MLDIPPFIHSPFTTKVEWEGFAALPVKEQVMHPAILSKLMGMTVVEASLRDQGKMGGMSGDIKFWDVVLSSGEHLALVLKTAGASPLRSAMGNAREAFFYNELAPALATASIPRCYYARGDMASGEVLLLMEMLGDAVPSGTFFGGAQPNNWSHRAQLDALCAGNPGPSEITSDAFKLYARMHGTYWKDGELLGKAWLRGTAWYAGNDEASWVRAQGQAQRAWAQLRDTITDGSSPIEWDAHLVACLDASFAKVDWRAYQASLAGKPFTLVHATPTRTTSCGHGSARRSPSST